MDFPLYHLIIGPWEGHALPLRLVDQGSGQTVLTEHIRLPTRPSIERDLVAPLHRLFEAPWSRDELPQKKIRLQDPQEDVSLFFTMFFKTMPKRTDERVVRYNLCRTVMRMFKTTRKNYVHFTTYGLKVVWPRVATPGEIMRVLRDSSQLVFARENPRVYLGVFVLLVKGREAKHATTATQGPSLRDHYDPIPKKRARRLGAAI